MQRGLRVNVTERTRRELLIAAGALAGTSLLGCGVRSAALHPIVGEARRRRGLVPVNVSPARVIRTEVGLRPFRRSGFLVRADTFGNKLLIHNYGHGGAGVTLSWGSAHLVLEELRESGRSGPAAVIGCGAVGLATARMLQRRGFEVAIYARDLPPDTTSDVAGASWYPSSVVEDALRTPAFTAQFEKAARFSHRSFQGLIGDRYGVQWRERYFLSEVPIEQPWEYSLLRDLFPDAHTLAPSDHPFASRYVAVESRMFIEPAVYLAALLDDFRQAGGRVHVTAFKDPAAVAALEEPIIVNCTGLGARELFGDSDLVAIKGQLSVLLPQPEIDYALGTNDGHGRADLYMYPRRDGILLGGTHERGVESLEPNLEAGRRLVEGHRAVFSGMRAP